MPRTGEVTTMKEQMMALSLMTGAMVLAASHAFGEAAHCAARDEVVARLGERYGETRHALGIAANSAVVEVYASDETGTWTILVSLPDGTSCLVASGEAFETVAESLQPSGLKL